MIQIQPKVLMFRCNLDVHLIWSIIHTKLEIGLIFLINIGKLLHDIIEYCTIYAREQSQVVIGDPTPFIME